MERAVDGTTISLTRTYDAPVEDVWDACTNPERIPRWFLPVSGDLRPGGRFRSVGAESGEPMVDGEVLEVEPGRRLVQTWRFLYDPELKAEGFTRVTYELEEAEGGLTKLTATHDLEGAPKTAEHVAGGWSYILSGLKTLLETGEPLKSF